MTSSSNNHRRFSRSPLPLKNDDIVPIKLTPEVQKRLGCVVNEHVFLECPYAFVSRGELLDLAQEPNSTLKGVVDRIKAREAPELLVGYASEKIVSKEAGDFLICLTEQSTESLITHNRSITKSILKLVHEEIRKTPKPWKDLGSSIQLEDHFLKTTRSLFEIDLCLPTSELYRPRPLSDFGPDDVRDGCVELTPLYEKFENVKFTTISQESQTNLGSRDVEAQTYPGNPEHQWTQYEFEIPEEFTEIWKDVEEVEQGEDEEEKDKESTSEMKEGEEDGEPQETEEELQRKENRRQAWENLTIFLKTHADKMIDTISFNASTNLYRNDVANLSTVANPAAMFADPPRNYENLVSLLDLKTTGNRCLFSMSWHCELDDILACTYSNRFGKGISMVVLWALDCPLKPRMLVKCEEKVSVVEFCPLVGYTDVMVGGCLDGTIVVWEINRQLLAVNIEKPEPRDAKVATSVENAQQKLTITRIQWLPFWCRIASDGNFQKIPVDSPRGKRSCFATSSTDGTIFFWNLPKSLSIPSQARSPLHLTISPIYQLILEKTGEKVPTRIPINTFLLPLAKTEEASSLSIRDQADLERLRKVYIGTCRGEILYCGWESQTFAVDAVDKEVLKVIHKCEIHDGIVRCMTKSPHLDDVFLTVGGRVFAVWKEDHPRAPMFHRRSKGAKYGEGCWSGRSGMFVLARLDGRFEVWDLKRKADQPVLVQTVSEKVTPYIIASPLTYRQKLLSVLDGTSTVRVFVEPEEEAEDEDLERIEWFEEFVWRETTRKLDFHRWQDDYLVKNPMALRRKQEREQAEANRRHQEARERFLKEQEAQARLEEERRLAKRRVSKTVILRRNEQIRAETILLEKKGFVPAELEAKRKPLVDLEELRKVQAQKVKEDLGRADELLEKSLVREVPEMRRDEDEREIEGMEKFIPKSREEYEQDYEEVREELMKRMKERPYVPKFDWKKAIDAGAKRLKSANKRKN